MMETFGLIIISFGLLICFFGVIGTIIFPDLFFRLHASTKVGTTGSGTVLIGLMFYAFALEYAVKLMVVLVFLFMTSPIISHIIAVAAVKNKVGFIGKRK
ncbi:MAG: monovalent cation/H(+) antiporter subunit G [Candidatus Muiribacteriota bacterium]